MYSVFQVNSHISRAVERFGRTEKLESHMVEVSFQQIPARTDSIPFSIFPQVLPTWISFSRTSLTEAEHSPISFQGGVLESVINLAIVLELRILRVD